MASGSICLLLSRREEIEWFYQEGASALYPEPWEDYLAPIPKAERRDLVSAYYRRLTSDNKEVRKGREGGLAGEEGGRWREEGEKEHPWLLAK